MTIVMDNLNFICVINPPQVDIICDEFMCTSVFLPSLFVILCLGLAPRCPTFLLSAHLSPLVLLKFCIFSKLTSHATVTRSAAPVLGSVYGKWAHSSQLGLILSDKPLLAWLALPAPVLGLPRSALYIRVEYADRQAGLMHIHATRPPPTHIWDSTGG